MFLKSPQLTKLGSISMIQNLKIIISMGLLKEKGRDKNSRPTKVGIKMVANFPPKGLFRKNNMMRIY